MIIKDNLNTLINNIKKQKAYAIFPYTKLTYCIFLLLKQYCIKHIYKLGDWLLVYFLYKKKNLKIKFFNLKNKKNIFTYTQLKQIKKKNKYGIIFTSKGICSLEQALSLKEGGILFCLLYYIN